MNEELLHGLRWVLMSDERGWVEEFDRVLGPVGADAGYLDQIRQFLQDKVAGADPSHRGRLQGMIRVLGERVLKASAPVGDAFAAAAARWVTLERRAAELDAQLEALRAEQRAVVAGLRSALVVSGPQSMGPWRFEAEPDRDRVRVTDPMKVPLDLLRREPDLDRILQRWRQTGSAPAGTVVETEPGLVLVLHEVVGGER